MANPSAFSAPYASEIVSTYDIGKPDELITLFRRRGDQGLSYFLLLKALGFTKPCSREKYGHWEEDWIHETITNKNNVSNPGAGVPVSITLSAADLTTGNRFYPRKWDEIIFPNRVPGIITAINVTTPTAPVLTVMPLVTTDNIGAIAAGQQLSIFTAAFSEGSGQPAGAFSGVIRYENYLQIIKESLQVTGTEMTNENWFKQISYNDSKGEPILAYYSKGQMDMEYRLALKKDGALLFNKKTTSTIVDTDTGRQLTTTEGLIPYITANGIVKNYTPGLFSVQKFDSINKALDKEHAGTYVLGCLGFDLITEIENVLKDYFQSTNIDYVKERTVKDLFGGNSAMGMAVGFKYLEKGDRVFNFTKMSSFDHSKLYGAPGYTTASLGFMVPLSTKRDKVSGEDIPAIGMRYKELGNYNRMYEIWSVGGAGNEVKVIPEDVRNFYMRCHVGAHHRAGNQMVLLNPS